MPVTCHLSSSGTKLRIINTGMYFKVKNVSLKTWHKSKKPRYLSKYRYRIMPSYVIQLYFCNFANEYGCSMFIILNSCATLFNIWK